MIPQTFEIKIVKLPQSLLPEVISDHVVGMEVSLIPEEGGVQIPGRSDTHAHTARDRRRLGLPPTRRQQRSPPPPTGNYVTSDVATALTPPDTPIVSTNEHVRL